MDALMTPIFLHRPQLAKNSSLIEFDLYIEREVGEICTNLLGVTHDSFRTEDEISAETSIQIEVSSFNSSKVGRLSLLFPFPLFFTSLLH
jgi:hypothetical protein